MCPTTLVSVYCTHSSSSSELDILPRIGTQYSFFAYVIIYIRTVKERNSPVRGEPMLKMLWLVVLRGEGSFVQRMLSRVGLRCGLDIHERHRRRSTPRVGRGTAATTIATAAGTGTGTAIVALTEGTAGTSVHGALLAPWQQLDALHASIPEKYR